MDTKRYLINYNLTLLFGLIFLYIAFILTVPTFNQYCLSAAIIVVAFIFGDGMNRWNELREDEPEAVDLKKTGELVRLEDDESSHCLSQ